MSTNARQPFVKPFDWTPNAAVASDASVAHGELIERLKCEAPHNIMGSADAEDLIERAEHLDRVLQAVEKYVLAILKDSQHSSNVTIDCSSGILGSISDLKGDICGALMNAADDLRGVSR